jgi:hypothetical protein
MSDKFKVMAIVNPDKYPSRMGQAWTGEETKDLLKAVEDGRNINDIATHHERTVGGIRARLCTIAADLHFNHKTSMEEIMTITGLNVGQIENAIFTREEKTNEKDMRKKKADVGDLMKILGEINSKLTELVEFKNKFAKK